MTDQELLELAAKASGEEYIDDMTAAFRCNPKLWNPLTDDGDALRLAVKLNMLLDLQGKRVNSYPNYANIGWSELAGYDRYAATRRAIVCAAAEIGKAMP